MLTIHRAERSDVLADALAQILRGPAADPFAPEVIAVPAKGVERWLSQRLATVLGTGNGGTDGVAANLRFPSPTRLVDEVIAAASGTSGAGGNGTGTGHTGADADPWAPGRLVWSLLEVVDASLGEPWCEVLSAHLGAGRDEPHAGHKAGRRYATAQHLHELFRSYAANRPEMLVDWAGERDTDGAGAQLAPDLRWQAELWRRLRASTGAPSPAERLEPACARLTEEPACSDLPARLSLFGATRLTTEQRAVLAALAHHRDIHLWLPHPSPDMWTAVSRESPPGRPTTARRAADRTARSAGHPLLASLGRDIRELQQLLPPGSVTHHLATPADGRPTLLRHVQAAIRENEAPLRVPAVDGSIQIHACHGPPRQVEVLREVLLRLFQDDPTLEPRDVLVMCPDIESYAPLVRAAFGQPTADHPGHRLRLRLADRSLRQTNPLLDTLTVLLTLADGRVGASDVLDLAASTPVRRRFHFREEDAERLRDWSARVGVRWGLDRAQREAFGLRDVPQNTWSAGLDRILLGVAADETDAQWLGLGLPLDDVDSSDIDLAGRLAELLDRLDAVLHSLQGQQTATAWSGALAGALEQLTRVGDRDAWQLAQARRELAEAAEHSGDALLRLADVRSLLSDRLAGRPTRANFRTGELTVCTMVPMRSVPHRVIALLGLDDGAFPRGGGVDGDDILQRDPCLGERDVRSEDRQLLLDAVMSARDHLLLLYTGADPITGATHPPAVPLGELIDVIRASVPLTGGTDPPGDVVTRHPLQAFDDRNFRAPAPFSFDAAAHDGARAARGARTERRDLLAAPLPSRSGPELDHLDLTSLVSFFLHPAKAFLSQRLGLRVPGREDAPSDALRAELDPLQKWQIGDRMLSSRLAGVPAEGFRHAEWRRGTLPPGPLGAGVLDSLESPVAAVAALALPLLAGPGESRDVAVELGGGRLLAGTVQGIHGPLLLSTTYSRLAGKHRLAAWVKLLALAGTPSAPAGAVTVGRGGYGRPAAYTLTLPPSPREVLLDLVALYDEGMCEPLPIATGASSDYASRRRQGRSVPDALEEARKAWDLPFGEGTDRHLALVCGGSFDRLIHPRAPGTGATRFGTLAERIWFPLLDAETVGVP